MHKDLLVVLFNTFLALGAKEELLSIVNEEISQEDLVKKLGSWSYNQLDEMKERIMSFKDVTIIMP